LVAFRGLTGGSLHLEARNLTRLRAALLGAAVKALQKGFTK